MFSKNKEQDIDTLEKEIAKVCKKIDVSTFSDIDVANYQYTSDMAQEELGLDEDLVSTLVEDFITQIVNTKAQFSDLLDTLENQKSNGNALDYTPLRELAHRNLGVAKNLRIEDAKVFLYELMKKDDLVHLRQCLEWLEACVVRLNPTCAYNAKKLLEVKSSL